MQFTIYLEFSYSPANYFEESLCEEKENYKLEIKAGKIKTILNESGSEKNSDFYDRIHEEIKAFF